MNNKYFLEKEIKVYMPIIILLVMIIIWLATCKFGTCQEILNQITFAATISSIILALVTIFYAIYQSNSTASQEAIVNESLLEIKSVVKRLNELPDRIDDIKGTSASNYDQIQVVSKTLEELMNIVNKMDSGSANQTNYQENLDKNKEQLLGEIERLQDLFKSSANDINTNANYDQKQIAIVKTILDFPNGISTYNLYHHPNVVDQRISYTLLQKTLNSLEIKGAIKIEWQGEKRQIIIVNNEYLQELLHSVPNRLNNS